MAAWDHLAPVQEAPRRAAGKPKQSPGHPRQTEFYRKAKDSVEQLVAESLLRWVDKTVAADLWLEDEVVAAGTQSRTSILNSSEGKSGTAAKYFRWLDRNNDKLGLANGC